jgi:hypothetical protein
VYLLGGGYTMPGNSNHVAKLSADVLSTENLESLGHIFDFATLPVEMLSTTFYSGKPAERMIGSGDF